MQNVAYCSPVYGLRGLLALDDASLDQVRLLQLKISQPRRVGNTVDEFRRLLAERSDSLAQPLPNLFPDNLVTVLYVHQALEKSREYPTRVVGMISFTIMAGQVFTEATLSDLIVLDAYQDQGVSTRLIEYCHKIFRTMGVSRAIASLPIKRSGRWKAAYAAAGYAESKFGKLEFRFRTEG